MAALSVPLLREVTRHLGYNGDQAYEGRGVACLVWTSAMDSSGMELQPLAQPSGPRSF